MISINSLTVSFGGFTLLDNIDFHISDNDKKERSREIDSHEADMRVAESHIGFDRQTE